MFWETFYKLCVEKNTSPNAVAKKIDVSNSTTTKWKNGTIPNGEILIKLANYFNVSIDYLLGRTEEPKQQNINHGNIEGNQGNIYNTETEKKLDETSAELLEQFKKLSLKNKGEAIRIICEMAEAEKEN